MYHILIVGSGYTGTAIAKHFIQKKQKVSGLVRSASSAARIEQEGLQPIVADLTKPETLEKIPQAHFIVLSPAPEERTEVAYRAIYLEGIKNFFHAIKKNQKPFLVVYLSSTGVYADGMGEWVDEETLAAPDSERSKILLEAERQVFSSGYPAVVFRLAGIYGPGRNRIKVLEEGSWTYPKEDRYMNMIHVDDVAGGVACLFKKGQEGHVYLGCDDQSVKQSEFYVWLCQQLKREVKSETVSAIIRGKRCRNDKLKSLGYSLSYPSYREGYVELIKNRILNKARAL